jgi:hypothetical protein
VLNRPRRGIVDVAELAGQVTAGEARPVEQIEDPVVPNAGVGVLRALDH